MTDWEIMAAAMAADQENAGLMMVAADALEEAGEPAKAEALRWLGERGLTGGRGEAGYNSYTDRFWIRRNGPNGPVSRRQFVASSWWRAAYHLNRGGRFPMVSRMNLIDAYADADPDTRAEWLLETEAGLALFLAALADGGTTNLGV